MVNHLHVDKMEENQLWSQSLFIVIVFQSTDLRKAQADWAVGIRPLMSITADLEKVENSPDTV